MSSVAFIPKIPDKVKGALRLGRAIRLVWESGPRLTSASVVLLVAQGLLPLLALYLMKLVVDAVTGAVGSPDKEAAFAAVLPIVVAAGSVALASAACEALSGLVSEAQSQAVTDHMHNVLHAKAVEVDLEYYENADYHNKLHRAQEEAPYRPPRIVRGLASLGQNSVLLTGAALLLFSAHPGIIAVLLLAAIPGVLVRLRFVNIMFNWQRDRTGMERRAGYFNYLLTLNLWAKEVRLFDLGPLFMRRFQELRGQIRRERIEIARRRSLGDFATQCIAVLPMFACFAFIAREAVFGRITLGALVMYYGAFQRGQGALQGALNSLLALYEDNRFLANLYGFLDLERKVVEPAKPLPVPRPFREGIRFEGVEFSYPATPRQALKGVEMTVGPGEVVALVGENGSGKTTLVKLLCRLYDPDAGRITVDGIDLRQFRSEELRSQIGVVFQDYAQYHLPARENIWFGNLKVSPNDERVEAAARQTGAHEVIQSLPHGYDTVLGKWLEEGEELSVGQWQKIAIARAFMRDAQIVVLDEPSSALDPKAEYEMFEKFRELIQGRSAILISHRLSTVRMADRIYVMENGRVVESGTHDELMERGDSYARLFETQAQYYR